MEVEVKEVNNKEIWRNFLSECEEKTFLNSWNWGEFQKKEGNKIWRLGIYNNEQTVAATLVIKIKAKRGTFLFVPHGPNIILDSQSSILKKEILEILTKKLKKIAKEEKAGFIRIAPIWKRNKENIKIFKELNFKEAPIHMHPELTWELNISKPENELLMNMRKTTRYLIRQGEKNNDIEVIKSIDINNLKKFNKIYQKTAERHHFTPFSLKYLENQLSAFLADEQILIFLGKYKNEIISSAIIVFWQNIAFYHHGASLFKYNSNKVPVSYLLQWEVIKEAKTRGCRIYNFWGIAPIFVKTKAGVSNFQFSISKQIQKQPLGQSFASLDSVKFKIINKGHPWYGLTLFKMGFGGHLKEYVKTQDLVLSNKYYLTYIFEKLRKLKRRV